MSAENKDEQSLIERLRHTYRLVVMNNETFEEVGSYRTSLLYMYIIGGIAVLLLSLLVILLISFTPLRKLIPGYGDVREHKEIYELHQELDKMQEELDVQRTYSESFRKRMLGEAETEDEVTQVAVEMPDSLLNVERIEEDEELRKEIAMSERVEQADLEAEKEGGSNFLPIEEINFYPPLNGSISEGFMPEKKHLGVDIMAPKNTPIKATLDGVVITADWTVETGNTIGIQHSNNLISFYKHNSALLKKTGEAVEAGEVVAIIGNSGTLSNGPHLHFELWYDGQAIDPSKYIDF